MNSAEFLDFGTLEAIVAIAEEGTFIAAAARLHISQSAISTKIGNAERNLGIRVFYRDRGTALTTEGEVLYRYAKDSLRSRTHVVQTVQAIHAGRMTPLRLAFTPFVSNQLLKRVSDLYRELIPDSDVFAESEDTEESIARLRDADCDAAIVTLPINDAGLDVHVLEQERLVVCMRSDDPLAAYDAVPTSGLDNTISVFSFQKDHPVAHERLMQMFAEVCVTPRPCKPTMNIDHVQWMVKEGASYALIREGTTLIPGLTTRPISDVAWTVDTAIVCRQDHGNPALAMLVEELLKRQGKSSYPSAKKPATSVGKDGISARTKDRSSKQQMPRFSGKVKQ